MALIHTREEDELIKLNHGKNQQQKPSILYTIHWLTDELKQDFKMILLVYITHLTWFFYLLNVAQQTATLKSLPFIACLLGTICCMLIIIRDSQVALVVKNPPAYTGEVRDVGSIPGSGRFPGGAHGNPLQYSCLENAMDRVAWRATVQVSRRVGHDWSDLSLNNGKIIFLKIHMSLPSRQPNLESLML